jgi:hypothetical protein
MADGIQPFDELWQNIDMMLFGWSEPSLASG